MGQRRCINKGGEGDKVRIDCEEKILLPVLWLGDRARSHWYLHAARGAEASLGGVLAPGTTPEAGLGEEEEVKAWPFFAVWPFFEARFRENNDPMPVSLLKSLKYLL